MLIKFKKTNNNAKIPVYATEGSSGADLYCIENFRLPPKVVTKVDTGLQLADMDTGYELQVRPRSGLAAKGIIVVNSPGTIDCDYRGNIQVLLLNLGFDEVHCAMGDRIAQLIVAPVVQSKFEFSEAETKTNRGSGSFGSTGK